jgi:hypothetical protein
MSGSLIGTSLQKRLTGWGPARIASRDMFLTSKDLPSTMVLVSERRYFSKDVHSIANGAAIRRV